MDMHAMLKEHAISNNLYGYSLKNNYFDKALIKKFRSSLIASSVGNVTMFKEFSMKY